MDKKTFRRKFFLRAATARITLIPLVGGLTVLFAMWVLSIGSVLTEFLAGTAVLVGIGIALSRILLQSESIAKEVLVEVKAESERAREARLDQLYQELHSDGDNRTQDMLQDLRILMDAFHNDQALGGKTHDALGIITKVDELSQGCIHALEQSLAHYRRGSQLRSPAAKRAFMDRREKVIREVEESIQRLSEIHAKIEELSIGNDDPSAALRELNEDLDASLQAAEKVEKRLHGFMDEELDQDLKEFA